jgi:ribonuclease BN (tRNA processing enzyme)
MTDENYIKFLGTSGSRWVVARQLRASGGVYVSLCGHRLHLDPGPGALVRCALAEPPIDPATTEAVIVTHSHIDHCNDVNIMIDAMTGGGFNRGGTLFAPASCLGGENSVIMGYLRPFLDAIVPLEASRDYQFGTLAFATSAPHQHGVDTFGITFRAGGKTLGFLVDTRFFPELPSMYAAVDILVIHVTFYEPPPHPRILHLGVDDVRRIIREARPGKVVLTHFGMSMLEAGPERVAAELTDELGVQVTAANDGLVVPII